MEIQEISLPVFYLNRILGVAPYTIKRNAKGQLDLIRRSSWWCIYSAIFLTAAVSLTFRFIIVDANSKSPIRMRTATSKFVTSIDVCVVVGVSACGAISGLFGLQNVRDINRKLREADKELALFNDEVRDKKRGVIMLVAVFCSITGMIAMDITSRYRSAYKMKTAMEMEHKETDEVNIQSYIPFYVLYYVLMGLHAQFTQTALGVARRYRRLNMALQSAFTLKIVQDIAVGKRSTKDQIPSIQGNLHPEILLPGTNLTVLNRSSVLRVVQDENSMSTVNTKISGQTNTITRTSYFLDRLSFTHATLGEAVGIISASFGLTLLAMLASCLLHLVATSYFLFLELLGDPDIFVALLQLLWCLFHVCRLLLIVEPCSMASVEAGKTIIIVCEILRNCKDRTVEHNLRGFWRQLIADRTYFFSACGMCKIDRQILTSFSGAIATYLVILIQFQKTDG